MTRSLFVATLLALSATACFAQASAPADAASTPKHKWIKKLKNHKPGASATNPETSPDKKGGQ
jgi:hypothetical protein